MKLALLSDLHANRQAFDACMAHARAQGAERFALLGDLVGYGAEPRYVVQQAMALAAQGAVLVQGNHDAQAADPPAVSAAAQQAPSMAALSAAWTHAQLAAEERDFLAALPLTAVLDGVLLVHATADAPERWRYADNAVVAQQSLDAATQHPGVQHVFCGHVHQQSLFYRGTGRGLMRFAPVAGVDIPVAPHRQWLATVGSVGQPRDGDARAMYALLDTRAWLLRFERVAYDHEAAAAAIRATGALPEFFAQRLERGQ
ncbi:MAG: metallophosphoesterase family protein [Pseudomonadota bacterium]